MAEIRGGEKLEKALVEITAKLNKHATLRVGFFKNAVYPDGTPVAMVAAINNYGAPRAGIPPRPFFSNAIAKHQGDWPQTIRNNLSAYNYDTKETLKALGAEVKGQIQQSIRDTNEPPLKPATIKRKGFSKPLIETGDMLKSVDFEVLDG